jgi:hypothetical protein
MTSKDVTDCAIADVVNMLRFMRILSNGKKVENQTVFFEEMMECVHLIFWPGSQRSVHCHTAKQSGIGG